MINNFKIFCILLISLSVLVSEYSASQWNINSIDTITKDNFADFIPSTSKLMAVDNTNSLHIVWQKRESPNTWAMTKTLFLRNMQLNHFSCKQ